MYQRILFTTIVAASLSVVSAQNHSAGGPQTITGLLMDASCPAIHSSGREASSEKPQTSVHRDGPNQDASGRSAGAVQSRTTERSESGGTKNSGPHRSENKAVTKSEDATSSTATAGPSQASATGTTGAAVDTAPPPQRGNLESVDSGQGRVAE